MIVVLSEVDGSCCLKAEVLIWATEAVAASRTKRGGSLDLVFPHELCFVASGTFDTHNVLPDASTVSGPPYDLYNQLFLPTEGASGGASGHLGPDTKEGTSVNTLAGNAAGGGLIWLSAPSASGSVSFGNWVVLRAEGYPGGVVSKHVAAGGAGGQILIFATKIATADEAGQEV